jgi:glycosyltransferase involved in cell wall biosynthesis
MTAVRASAHTGLDNHAPTVASAYFERRDLSLEDGEIVVLACMRNEAARLPHFLDHYRRLGVDRFLLVDNGSTDRTSAYLSEQPDVEYFWTSSSYRGSAAGRLWLQEIADVYAAGHWVITVDVDELLVFPGSESILLGELCTYLDDNGFQGLFAILLDMYSDRPLSQTKYEPGADFLEVCPYFETDTYSLSPGGNPPFLRVSGGPRDRLFREHARGGPPPMMKKVPLVRWQEGFSYIFSTHSHRYVPLADITGTLLHFKFFDTFEDVAAVEARRGDRRQQSHYRTYQATVDDGVCFYGSQSRRYHRPGDLVRLGVMGSTSRYERFVTAQLRASDRQASVRQLLPEPIAAEGALSLRSLAAIWPLVNNPGMAEYFGQAERPAKDRRLAFVEEISRHIKVVDVTPDHLVVRVAEPALHRWRRSPLGMSVCVGRSLVRNLCLGGADDAMHIDVDALEPGICRLPIDIAGAALRERHGAASVAVAVYLFDAGADDGVDADSGTVQDRQIQREDVLLYHQPWFPDGALAVPATGIRGTVDRIDDGTLRGWAYDAEQDTFDVAICVYINGRLARHAWPTQRRRDLDGVRNAGSTARSRGFVIDLPLGYFDADDHSVRVDVVAAGRNIAMRRSPIVLPPGVRDARWDGGDDVWRFRTEPVAGQPIAAGVSSNGAGPTTRPWWKVWT